MRPSQLKLALHAAFKTNRPIMIHGSPGIGKSDIVDQVRQEAGFEHLEDLRLSQLDQVDLRGVPSVTKDGITTWNPPEFLKLPPKSVLFLDEINSAAAGVMAAAYQLVLNRRIGNLILPNDCRIVCAGNLSTDFSMVNQMPAALKNRMTHVTLEVHNDDWNEWALRSEIHESVIAFLRFRPTLLNEFDHQSAKSKESKQKARNMREATAFATPRTWEMMSDYLVTDCVPREIEYEVITGIVGEAAAAEFTAFQQHYRDLPDIDACLNNPTKAKVPKEPPTLYALATAMACKAALTTWDARAFWEASCALVSSNSACARITPS